MESFNPRLYVGTYNKYDAGSTAGEWLTLADYADAEEFYAACKDVHADEHDPEFMFQSFGGFPAILYSESGGIDELFAFIELMDTTDLDYDAVGAALECFGAYIVDNFGPIEDSYHGEYSSDAAFAADFADHAGLTAVQPAWLHNCIDWEYAARELMYNYVEHNGHYFRNV